MVWALVPWASALLACRCNLLLFNAGSETTGYSIAWTLYLLAKHPAALAALEKELDGAGLLATPARPHPRPFAFADISRLRYLDAVLKARVLTQTLCLVFATARACLVLRVLPETEETNGDRQQCHLLPHAQQS